MTTAQALASGSVVLDATGAGVVRVQPDRAHTWWRVTRMVVSCTGATATEFRVYRSVVSPANLLDSTRDGLGDTSETDFEIQPGESLVGAFSEGTSGETGTFVVYGSYMGRTN